MKRQDNLFISKLVDKVLNETIEERANSLVSKLKHKEMKETNIKSIINSMKGEVNELGGMDDGHPKLGRKKLPKTMSDEEIDDILSQLRNDDYGDVDHEDYVDEIPSKKGNWVYPHDEELDELYDSGEAQDHFDDMEYDEFNFEPMDGIKPNMDDLEGGTTHGREFMKDFERKREFAKKLRRGFRGEENEEQLYEIEMESKGEVCEQCGVGEISEGVCNECGSSSGMMDESNDIETNEGGCNAVKEVVKSQGHVSDLDEELMERYGCSSLKESFVRRGLISESLKGNQKKIDKNKNNKIDSEDFAILRRGKKSETKESSKPDFLDLDKDGDKKEPMKKASKDKKGKKETVTVTESELIELIESMVSEELTVAGNKPKGLSEYEKAHKGSEKENKEYFKSLKKKMDDYLKDGSKGDYEENPKHFPKGNGELAKMNKKAFTMTDENEDFNYGIAGLNIPTPDAIEFNEDFMDKLYMGDSTTGNKPGGNALESEANERFNKIRKKNPLKKLKDQSYKRVSSPVYNEKSGDDKGKGLNIKLESTNKETKVLNEEFEKIKNLMKYDRKTQ
jgi:ribosomal protein L32